MESPTATSLIMGNFRFYKRVHILPYLHVNVAKRGMSLWIGGPGASWNISRRGQRTTRNGQ